MFAEQTPYVFTVVPEVAFAMARQWLNLTEGPYWAETIAHPLEARTFCHVSCGVFCIMHSGPWVGPNWYCHTGW